GRGVCQEMGTAAIVLLYGIPMIVAAWAMPLMLSVGLRPWVDGLVLYPAAIGLLALGLVVGQHLGGIDGTAWGGLVCVMPLPACQLLRLWHSGVLSLRSVWLVTLVMVLLVLACSGILLL